MEESGKLLLSVSRRTDIPAYFGNWFSERLARGWVDVKNPYNQRIRRISLLPDSVLGYVFWSKNPFPFMAVLDRVLATGVPVLYHVTVTGLPREVEPHIPDPAFVVRGIRMLADRIPTASITWRFDPTMPGPGEKGQLELRERFLRLAVQLDPFAARVALSVLDPYKKIKKRMDRIPEWKMEWDNESACRFDEWIQRETPFSGRAFWCTEPDLPSSTTPACIDRDILCGLGVDPKALMQSATRPGCLCAQAVDIGAYDTCLGGCAYCYAVRSHDSLQKMPD